MTKAVRCHAGHRKKLCSSLVTQAEYCRFHLRKIFGLVIKRSGIRTAGLGLWTSSQNILHKGDLIGEYKGKVLTELQANTSNSLYLFELEPDYIIDAQSPRSCHARFINASRAQNVRSGETCGNNSKFVWDKQKKQLLVYATKTIQPNTEILASYGRSYWNQVRKNAQIAS